MTTCGKIATAAGTCGELGCRLCYPEMVAMYQAPAKLSVAEKAKPRWHYLRGLWCTLFHYKHKTWWPVHHSHAFRCNKCGVEGEVWD